MSEMKMSDVFALPVFARGHGVGERCSLFEGKGVTVASSFYSNQLNSYKAIEYAINNHDRMVEEIAELQAALELMVLHFESNHNSEHECEVIKLSKKILPNLNQEGEE